MSEIVYSLYRVSTVKQVDKVKDDIPMQRFCQENGLDGGKRIS